MSDIQAPEASLLQMKALFLQAPMPVAITRGPKHTYEAMNSQYRRLVGEKLKNKDTAKLMDEVYKTGKAGRINECQCADQYFNFVFQPIRNGRKKVEAIMQVGYDVTDQVKERFIIMDTMERNRDDFVAVATHELKTPVTSIKAYAQVLQNRLKQRGDTGSAYHLARMDRQINKLADLIADLLDASKIQAGRLFLRKQRFTFDPLVAEIVGEMQTTTDNHTLTIRGSTDKRVYADRERIGQVLINFLTNAIKYSPGNKKIVIQLFSSGKEVKVSVRDRGIGIEKKNREHIFDRFYRVGCPQSHTYPGLGLGLFISSEIIKRHKGTIGFESAKGKGSTFYFTLPV